MEFHDVSILLMGLSHPILYLKDMKVGFHLETLLPVMHHGPRLAGAAFHGWVQRFGTAGALCVLERAGISSNWGNVNPGLINHGLLIRGALLQ
jgi:hypothetical protein